MSGSPERILDLDLAADLDGLRAGLTAIERHCGAVGLPAAVIARILAVFEEIFTNTVKYGYRGQHGMRIHAFLSGSGPAQLTVEDSAPPFDPTTWNAAPDLAGDLSTRPVGRVGIALVMGLARNVRWQPLAPGNRLTLEFSVEGV